MARRRTDAEITARMRELLNQHADLEKQLGSLSSELRDDIEALTGATLDSSAASARHVDLDRVLELLGRLAIAPTESDAVEIVISAARELLPGTQGALCRAVEGGAGMATVGVWDLDQQWNRPYGQSVGTQGPESIARRVSDGPTGTAEVFPMTGFGLAMGELRVWGGSEDDGLERTERHGRSELLARSAGLVLSGMYLQRSLRQNAIFDPLTELYSRGYLLENLDREIHRSRRKAESLGLIMIDVDQFGPFNDTYGPDAGDRMLKAIADSLRGQFRHSDIACRYSGERFALVLAEADTDTTWDRAEALRQCVAELSVDGGRITISGGVAAYPQHGDTAAELINASEGAIIAARHAGGNRIQIATSD